MNICTLLLIGTSGGAGAAVRYLAGVAFPEHHRVWSTVCVNLLGSFLLGMFTSIWAGSSAQEIEYLAICGTGFCGGLTTFSACSVDALELLAAHRRLTMVLYLSATILGCIAAVIAGFTAASYL